MPQSASIAIRSYRLHFRDGDNRLARTYDVDLGSAEDARELAALMLDEQGGYASVEVWDRVRLVCTVQGSHE